MLQERDRAALAAMQQTCDASAEQEARNHLAVQIAIVRSLQGMRAEP